MAADGASLGAAAGDAAALDAAADVAAADVAAVLEAAADDAAALEAAADDAAALEAADACDEDALDWALADPDAGADAHPAAMTSANAHANANTTDFVIRVDFIMVSFPPTVGQIITRSPIQARQHEKPSITCHGEKPPSELRRFIMSE